MKYTDIKNGRRYYFDDINDINNFDLENILLNEIPWEIILIYDTAYKIPYNAKPLCNIFNKVDGYITKNDKTKNLVLFRPKKFETMLDRIRHVILLKSNVSFISSHKYIKIKIDSGDHLDLQKNLKHV